jgi:glycosyltransferase involved in cell wall biosynthesis
LSRIPKVLFLNPWDRFIGPNRYLFEMLRHAPELARKAIVVFERENGAAAEYKCLGSEAIVCPHVEQIRAQLRVGNFFKLLRQHTIGVERVIKLIRSVGPDLIVSNTEQLLVAGVAAHLLGIPHIKIFHTMSFAYRLANRPLLMKAYLRAFSIESDRVVAVSETLRRALVSGGLRESKVTIIPNPLPIRDLKAAADQRLPTDLEVRLAQHSPIIANAGVIFPRKGQDQLIEALPAICEKFPKTLCVFAGRVGDSSGFENTNGFYKLVQDRVQRLKLNNNVLFVGDIDYLPSLLRRADVYVQTSRTESFGRVIAESLVCGTPVVSYAVGAIPEVAGPGAVLVDAGDIGGLAQKVAELLGHPDQKKKLVEEGRKHVEQCYEGSIVAEKFSQLLIAEASKGRWPS